MKQIQQELNQIQTEEVQGSGSESPSPEATSSSTEFYSGATSEVGAEEIETSSSSNSNKDFSPKPLLKKKCIDCREEFKIKPGEDWKIRCILCFIKMKNGNAPVRKQEVIMPSVKYEETPAEKCIKTGLTGVFVVSTHLGKVELKPEDINEIEVGGFGTRDGRLDTKAYGKCFNHHVYSVPNYELEELQEWLGEHKKVIPNSNKDFPTMALPIKENIMEKMIR